MVLSEEKLYSLGRRCVYIFNRRKAKKEIPDENRSRYFQRESGQSHHFDYCALAMADPALIDPTIDIIA